MRAIVLRRLVRGVTSVFFSVFTSLVPMKIPDYGTPSTRWGCSHESSSDRKSHDRFKKKKKTGHRENKNTRTERVSSRELDTINRTKKGIKFFFWVLRKRRYVARNLVRTRFRLCIMVIRWCLHVRRRARERGLRRISLVGFGTEFLEACKGLGTRAERLYTVLTLSAFRESRKGRASDKRFQNLCPTLYREYITTPARRRQINCPVSTPCGGREHNTHTHTHALHTSHDDDDDFLSVDFKEKK